MNVKSQKYSTIHFQNFQDKSPMVKDNRTDKIHDHVKAPGNIRLKGSYESFRYFQHIEKLIRTQLKFNRVTQSAVDSFIRKQTPCYMTNTPVTYIGIHIRRGDFLRFKVQKRGRPIASKDYVNRAKHAMKKIYDNILFIATSDDKRWLKENIVDNNTILSHFSKAKDDLALLVNCNHTIISSGTFSWWAGWLANGTTIYYDLHPKPGSSLASDFKRGDYYPPDWIPMS